MTTAEIAATLRYCDAHCDNEGETAIVRWVAEHFADALTDDWDERQTFLGHALLQVGE